uniref:Uncharacterized protein n=1 Tax=Arundo donax TaxID=35708 RepID=A0A0A9E693_ARUDO
MAYQFHLLKASIQICQHSLLSMSQIC